MIVLISEKKFDMVDIQNATLSGGVAVGAVADLAIPPYGAFIIGSLTGIISTLGYRLVQVMYTTVDYRCLFMFFFYTAASAFP